MSIKFFCDGRNHAGLYPLKEKWYTVTIAVTNKKDGDVETVNLHLCEMHWDRLRSAINEIAQCDWEKEATQ